ncbi:MAG: GIY-YIG nuclease family protein [Candidatus Marinimicrobia bacterium]|nr:GIY-YIG nuclease family protein [Candidatus Neomarinimicrobiota bacterium]
MYYVYVLYSEKIDRLYIGQTKDLDRRLREHFEGDSFYTKRADDWKHFHTEEIETRSQAMKREKQLKSARGRDYLRKLL